MGQIFAMLRSENRGCSRDHDRSIFLLLLAIDCGECSFYYFIQSPHPVLPSTGFNKHGMAGNPHSISSVIFLQQNIDERIIGFCTGFLEGGRLPYVMMGCSSSIHQGTKYWRDYF
jgi:hypothetical protein